ETEEVYETIVPRGAEAMLLVELQGEEPLAVRKRLMGLLQRLQRRGKAAVSYRLTTDRSERNLLWRLARRVIPRLYRLKGSSRPLPFIEDLSIPPKRLPEFLVEVQNILKAERVTATIFAHALHGQVDVRPFLDLGNPDDQVRLATLSNRLYERLFELGGCISGEHAIGLSRAGFAEKQLGARIELSRQVKRLFDPAGILNPGKYLSPTPPRVNENLRLVPRFEARVHSFRVRSGEAARAVELSFDGKRSKSRRRKRMDGPEKLAGPLVNQTNLQAAEAPDGGTNGIRDTGNGSTAGIPLPLLLDWETEDSIEFTSRSCNGCGRCRTSADAERMCPMFRVHHGEEASPRAKANLLRGLLTGAVDRDQLESDELKQINDLCFNCHQCRIDCPASVDVPKLVLEAKAQHVASHGLRFADRFLNRIDWLAALGSRTPRLTNWALRNATMRWLFEKTIGIAQGRKLPKVTRRSFLSWAAREKLNRIDKSQGRKILLFVDQYVNWHNPVLGRAAVEVLRHQKIDCYVPTSQTPSWMAMIASGDVVRAKKLAKTNVRVLAEAVRQGYEIVTIEPSAAMCLKEEYRSLFKNEDTELIAKHTWDINGFLWRLHARNELELDFRPVTMSVVYHEPCHSRALDTSNPAYQLLGLIPGLQLEKAEEGCSGMAGTFGLKRKHFRTSVRIGRGLIGKMRTTTAQFGVTECTACKLQMEQGTTKPTVHPVAVMAYAYGRMPQLGAWFSSRNEGPLVS
ncbi:MAG: anaerobic glycerol-3-phosphate dehydrogenase subunit C, partial [Planctomycetota bacterium]